MRRRTYVAVAAAVACSVALAAYLALPSLGGGEISVRDGIDVSVGAADVETGGDGSRTCTAAGPPPGFVSVLFRATARDYPNRNEYSPSYSLVVEVLGESTERRLDVPEGAARTVSYSRLFDAGSVSLRKSGREVDSVTRTVAVTEERYGCVDSP